MFLYRCVSKFAFILPVLQVVPGNKKKIKVNIDILPKVVYELNEKDPLVIEKIEKGMLFPVGPANNHAQVIINKKPKGGKR